MCGETEKPSLLLVEENEDDILMARRAFKEFKVISGVHVARGAQEALDLLSGAGNRNPVRPSIILLDISLPQMDGISLLRRLKADPSLRIIPVVMFTSSVRREDILSSYVHGAASYVSKPGSLEDYIDFARRFETYWFSVSSLPSTKGPGRLPCQYP